MTGHEGFPRERSPDSTLALLADGYEFISRRCERHGSDAFVARLMLREATCVRGADAARMFYVRDRFTRRGAMPSSLFALLQDEGSVATLDGEAHRHRKAMFLGLMTDQAIADICGLLGRELDAGAGRWEAAGEVVLFDALEEAFCRTVCRWCGVPLEEAEVAPRTRELSAMISGAGAVGPRNWRGHVLRRRCEKWARDAIRDIRDGRRRPAEDAPAAIIARHRDLDGEPLSAGDAAIELINLLRPTVAVARFATFAAAALHDNPQYRERLAREPDFVRLFVQETRRYYPFFPFVAGRVRMPFEWLGVPFDEGARVLLDLYGTGRDPAAWAEPDAFRPERFADWGGSAYDFIPQGGGDVATGHRCPGEWITIALMEIFVRKLAAEVDYEIPPQDLRVDLSTFPALPASRVVLRNVRRRAGPG